MVWFWYKNIQFMIWRHNLNSKLMRLFFCKRGLHRLITGSHEVTNSNGLRLKSQYIRCIYCETHFFTNEHNKKQYRRIKANEKHDAKKLINYMLDAMDKKMQKPSNIKSGRMQFKEFKPYPHKR